VVGRGGFLYGAMWFPGCAQPCTCMGGDGSRTRSNLSHLGGCVGGVPGDRTHRSRCFGLSRQISNPLIGGKRALSERFAWEPYTTQNRPEPLKLQSRFHIAGAASNIRAAHGPHATTSPSTLAVSIRLMANVRLSKLIWCKCRILRNVMSTTTKTKASATGPKSDHRERQRSDKCEI
jgi:hypothetical protein